MTISVTETETGLLAFSDCVGVLKTASPAARDISLCSFVSIACDESIGINSFWPSRFVHQLPLNFLQRLALGLRKLELYKNKTNDANPRIKPKRASSAQVLVQSRKRIGEYK